jgi:hypothetical protein
MRAAVLAVLAAQLAACGGGRDKLVVIHSDDPAVILQVAVVPADRPLAIKEK